MVKLDEARTIQKNLVEKTQTLDRLESEICQLQLDRYVSFLCQRLKLSFFCKELVWKPVWIAVNLFIDGIFRFFDNDIRVFYFFVFF